MSKEIVIISNERFFQDNDYFFCDNIAEKSLPDDLSDNFEVEIIGRHSEKKRAHKLKTLKIKGSKNFFSYLGEIYKNSKVKKKIFLILSISPYTFFACILLFFLKQKTFVFLRSDGYEEYKSKFGILGFFIYHIMFFIVSKITNLIGCNKKILRGNKGKVLYPSELTDQWFLNKTKPDFDRIKILYVGRIRVEKGIFSFLKILKKITEPIFLTIVGSDRDKYKSLESKNVKVYKVQSNIQDLINFYDQNQIFVLPSFTEGHPMVLLEALVRERPVVVFEEIEHVLQKYEGVFVCKRDHNHLLNLIKFIDKNYEEILEKMKKNRYPTKENFFKQLNKILN